MYIKRIALLRTIPKLKYFNFHTNINILCVPGYPCTCLLVVKSIRCLFNMIMKVAIQPVLYLCWSRWFSLETPPLWHVTVYRYWLLGVVALDSMLPRQQSWSHCTSSLGNMIWLSLVYVLNKTWYVFQPPGSGNRLPEVCCVVSPMGSFPFYRLVRKRQSLYFGVIY